MKKLFITISLACAIFYSRAQTFKEEDLRKHIQFLASDKLEGREPGTAGERKAYHYIAREFRKWTLKPYGKRKYYQSFRYRVLRNPHDSIPKFIRKKGTNVIGFLDNRMPKTMVIGAHYDHLGKRAHSSSLDRNNRKGLIHNGADDNASGAAGVLLLAKYFATNSLREHCNFLFICFSGEEDGLMGSKYFTQHPTIDTTKITCMINMDMIGRLNDTSFKLMVYGVGTCPDFHDIFTSVYLDDFKMVYDSSGIGPSDQTSFYLKKIPAIHFFTGQHGDYHRSTDDEYKINYPGEMRVLTLIARVAMKLSYKDTLIFTPTRQNEQEKISFKVTLGLMPDYTFDGKGMRIDAVTEGKPASKAGILAGDIITRVGEMKIDNVYTYMKALSEYRKGDVTEVEVMRNNESIVLRVRF